MEIKGIPAPVSKKAIDELKMCLLRLN